MLKIAKIEAHIQKLDRWKSLCLATSDDDTSCSPIAFTSPLTFLKYSPVQKPLEDLEQKDIDAAWDYFYQDKPRWNQLKALYNIESDIISKDKVYSMRAFMTFGFPL